MGASAAVRIGDEVPSAFRGRAYAVLEQTCFIRTPEGEQFVLLAEGLPAAPHGITVRTDETFKELIARDAPIGLSNGMLKVTKPAPRRPEWSLADAERYDSLLERTEPGTAEKRAAAYVATSSALAEHERRETVDRATQTARRRVRSAVTRLSAAVAAEDTGRAIMVACGLVGFGSGLSPKGDDALVGFLAARAALGLQDGELIEAIRREASHTSEASWGFVLAATRSRFCEPIAELASAVCAGDSARATRAAHACLSPEAFTSAESVIGLLGGMDSNGTRASVRLHSPDGRRATANG